MHRKFSHGRYQCQLSTLHDGPPHFSHGRSKSVCLQKSSYDSGTGFRLWRNCNDNRIFPRSGDLGILRFARRPVLSQSRTANGYGEIRVFVHNRWTHVVAHRISWILHGGHIPIGLFVLHKCDIRHCVNPKHLYIGTAKNNTADMMKHGRGNPGRGERHGRAVVNENLVRQIRGDVRSCREIAKEIGICHQAIAKIKLGRTWAHVKES